jgi:hypothetical protein
MREIFLKQLENAKAVTEEQLLKANNKTYYNGEPIKVGDKLLIGFHSEEKGIDENGNSIIELNVIYLNEAQIDLYELDNNEQQINQTLPLIKLKFK